MDHKLCAPPNTSALVGPIPWAHLSSALSHDPDDTATLSLTGLNRPSSVQKDSRCLIDRTHIPLSLDIVGQSLVASVGYQQLHKG